MYKWLPEKDAGAEKGLAVDAQKDVAFGQVELSVHFAVKGEHEDIN